MTHTDYFTIWHAPKDHRLFTDADTIIKVLEKEYGIPARKSIIVSPLPNHEAIEVPDVHMDRAAQIVQDRFGRFAPTKCSIRGIYQVVETAIEKIFVAEDDETVIELAPA